MKEGGVYHHDPDPRTVLRHKEGEWRLGCPVEHHKQGVHSNIKDLNKALKEVQIAPKKRTEEFQQI